ncbi:MAG: RluA family pseudouridine synthase [Bacteroidota bacterium]
MKSIKTLKKNKPTVIVKKAIPKKKENIKFLFEDNDIIVLSKPAGLLSLPDRYNHEEISLVKILKEKYEDIFVVHRLDKDTSGVMVFAKNADAHKSLNDQFESRKVTKLYHAFVAGIVEKDEITIDIPLTEDAVILGKMKPSARGKESLTILKVIKRFRHATLVELNLVTGRHHQIRVHCSSIGHPLLVDEMYGGASDFFLSSIKRKFHLKKHTDETPIISRITLHAHDIIFTHPVTQEENKFTAEYPRDFAALLQVLNKYSEY